MLRMEESIKDLPDSNFEQNEKGYYDAVDRLASDSFKAKYYFQERFQNI